MWWSKKFIIVALLVVVVVLGSTAGIVLARAGSGTTSGVVTQNADNASQSKTLLARVAIILGIDQQKLESAFTQAQKDMRNEALDKYLQNLVTQGKITQEQADKFKAWEQARPDVPLPGGGFRHFGGRGFYGGRR
ncbi:MAG: hypothetical protein HY529_06705 [Chloroflexi bacterium]|nr:hypothetical protein [Chloroflexota bacterium]